MYNYNINTSKRIRGAGDIMWGQKTGQVKTTALDRVNVRRLLLFIENTIEPSLQNYLFEPNNERTRSRATSNLNSFLQTVYSGGGLTAFQVVCDTTNNTAQVVDNNELAIDLYIQPTKTIEFINVQVVVTRTGVSFAELI
jgi:phage tail sheath protein FI